MKLKDDEMKKYSLQNQKDINSIKAKLIGDGNDNTIGFM